MGSLKGENRGWRERCVERCFAERYGNLGGEGGPECNLTEAPGGSADELRTPEELKVNGKRILGISECLLLSMKFMTLDF